MNDAVPTVRAFLLQRKLILDAMMTVHSHTALLPLTIFDDAWSPTNFTTGWLVEGIIDEHKLRAALTRLTHKWRLPAGRLEKVDHNAVSTFRIAL